MKAVAFPIILVSILLFAEITSFFAIRPLFTGSGVSSKTFTWIWLGLTVALYGGLFLGRSIDSNLFKNGYVNVYFIVLISKVFLSLFFMLALGVQWGKSALGFASDIQQAGFNLGRRQFSAKVALGLTALPFATMVWGIARTAYDFRIHRAKIPSSKLPAAFDGLKIVQISDIHTGSLQQRYQLQKAVNLILAEKPDVIVFTGDLVNNRTNEVYPYMDILAQLKAPLGVYSILGNHDYGDYEGWKTSDDKRENFEAMLRVHRDLGWKLMMNEHVALSRDGAQIALLGIENWGANLRFKKYGKMDQAHADTSQYPYKILLSHDPSHWTAEVQEKYPDVDLTLSGHTHGFQFGIEIPGIKWSPSKYIYPQWAGLYQQGEQFLYVNRGLGCLGYMGRVGINPEITVISLEKS